jgi:hypothetical protein
MHGLTQSGISSQKKRTLFFTVRIVCKTGFLHFRFREVPMDWNSIRNPAIALSERAGTQVVHDHQ